MIGKVTINANGDKAISFDDAAWAALPVGATIYAAGNGETPKKPQRHSLCGYGNGLVEDPEGVWVHVDDVPALKSVKLPPTEYFGDSWSGEWAITRENIVDCLEEHGIKVADE